MDEDGAPISGFDDREPFRVTPEAGGVSLESALRDYGPAAIDDLIPRLRTIAHELDAAHAAGHVHGALHPSKVIVHDDATSLIRGSQPVAPYAAPELAGGPATPKSDQYGLAAIAYEWLFGRPIDHPADRPVEVRTMPGVDRVTLSKAFTRALAPAPAARFASCNDFCSAVADAVIPELPFDSEREGAFLAQGGPLLALDEEDEADPVGPFVPEAENAADDALIQPAPFDSEHEDDIKIAAPFDSARQDDFLARDKEPDFDAFDARIAEPEPAAAPAVVPVPSWSPGTHVPQRSMETPRFGPVALFLAVMVGAVFGFAAGYMARPRALQSEAPAQIAVAPGTDSPVTAPPVDAAQTPAPKAPQAPAPKAPQAPQAPSNPGRLLVRSTPSGASVSVDGVAKGVTPVALRDLEIGTLSVVVARRGYIPETRRVVISKARPARTLDVRLSAAATATAPPRPSTPATLGKPASTATTGSLNVDSRPAGAAVTVNGKPSGNTPMTINDLPPGDYRIVMTMQGFRSFATTVRVVAGERVRAAASLTAQEQE